MKIRRNKPTLEDIKKIPLFAKIEDEKAAKLADQVNELACIVFDFMVKRKEPEEGRIAA